MRDARLLGKLEIVVAEEAAVKAESELHLNELLAWSVLSGNYFGAQRLNPSLKVPSLCAHPTLS
jgi:hypothetical protein